ncbi:hypothetical protein Lal_00042915 [Lupinus albus]|nr:hypothetical protein Lal_00042915 [Lupinus albus]
MDALDDSRFETILLQGWMPLMILASRVALDDTLDNESDEPKSYIIELDGFYFIRLGILASARDSRLGERGSPGRVKSWAILEDSRLSERVRSEFLKWAGFSRLSENPTRQHLMRNP